MSENNYEHPVLTRENIHEGEIQHHLEHITREFRDSFEFLQKYPKSITIFGSSTVAPGADYYKKAEELGSRIVKDLGYAVLTGGGPGVMEAANKGAYEAGGISLGLNVSIPHEYTTNAYVTHALKFSYFFSRKTMLAFAAEAYVFFPGGFGTFDELFSILTLIQTGKIPRVPILMYDSSYWKPLEEFLRKTMLEKYHTIEDGDLKLYEITDSIDRIVEVAKVAPISEWWRIIN